MGLVIAFAFAFAFALALALASTTYKSPDEDHYLPLDFGAQSFGSQPRTTPVVVEQGRLAPVGCRLAPLNGAKKANADQPPGTCTCRHEPPKAPCAVAADALSLAFALTRGDAQGRVAHEALGQNVGAAARASTEANIPCWAGAWLAPPFRKPAAQTRAG